MMNHYRISSLFLYSGVVVQSAEEAFIKQKISQPCVVFSKTYCPFCDSAKRTLTKEGAKFDVVELDVVSNGDAIQKTLAQLTGEHSWSSKLPV